MEDIINGNKQNVEKYLLSKHYVGDNKYIDFFKENIYKNYFWQFYKQYSGYARSKK